MQCRSGWDRLFKGNLCTHSHPKMPDRHFLCGCKDHRYGQCSRKAAPKPKGGRVSLAEVAEEVSE